MNIIVIGSMINSKEIEFSARALNTIDGYTVRYAKPIDEEIEDFKCAISRLFNDIQWCDMVYVVRKNNCEIGHGTIYLIEYASRLGKEIYYLN